MKGIDHVIEGMGQGHDVLPLDGRDESLVQPVHDLAGQVIPDVFQVLHLAPQLGEPDGIAGADLQVEELRGLVGVGGGGFQKVEEDHLPGFEPAHQGIQGHGDLQRSTFNCSGSRGVTGA